MKSKQMKVKASIESPTWGDLASLGTHCMELLGGNVESAKKLNGRDFYTLCILSSLNLDGKKASPPIFGKKHIT